MYSPVSKNWAKDCKDKAIREKELSTVIKPFASLTVLYCSARFFNFSFVITIIFILYFVAAVGVFFDFP